MAISTGRVESEPAQERQFLLLFSRLLCVSLRICATNQFAAYLALRSIVATRNCTRNGAEFPQVVREGRRREEDNKREVLSMYKTQTETERETHRQSERERERSFHFVQTRAWRISSNGFEAEDPPNFPFFIPEV